MSIRRLKARIVRLESLASLATPTWKLPYGFVIDPALAKAIRQEIDRSWEIMILNTAFGVFAETQDRRAISCLTGAEIAEQDQLMTRTTVFRRTPEGMARIPSYKKETLPAEEEKELSHLKSFCKVTPIWAGKPTVVCDDPVVIAHPKFNPGTW